MDTNHATDRLSTEHLRHNGFEIGFSLIELLVSVGVIILLITITLPSLHMAKLLAIRAKCQASLHVIGIAAGNYQADYKEHVPVAWQNHDPAIYPNPWKSWRACLLPYLSSFAALNCPAATDVRPTKPGWEIGQVFHSSEEVTGMLAQGTLDAGSYGVIYHPSLDSYQTLNNKGFQAFGHPCWSLAFSSIPGVSWADPGNTIYIADAVHSTGPPAYPSPRSWGDYGTAAIFLPNQRQAGVLKDWFQYFTTDRSRRFADRHIGTNVLMVNGRVTNYETRVLDNMTDETPQCIWDSK